MKVETQLYLLARL